MFNAFRASESLFPTETIRPVESMSDGGIIIDFTPGPDANWLAEDHLSVDPNNPNTEVDGRDFLIWQRGNATPGPDDNVEWPIGPIPELWLI